MRSKKVATKLKASAIKLGVPLAPLVLVMGSAMLLIPRGGIHMSWWLALPVVSCCVSCWSAPESAACRPQTSEMSANRQLDGQLRDGAPGTGTLAAPMATMLAQAEAVGELEVLLADRQDLAAPVPTLIWRAPEGPAGNSHRVSMSMTPPVPAP